MNINYNEEMKKIIKTFDSKKTILLHSCCGPCSSAVLEKLNNYFDITVLYYNPNIEPIDEYIKRKNVQIQLLNKLNIKYMEIDYLNNEYHNKVIGYENEPENGLRCHICYKLRLEKTAYLAKENNFDYFGTTLTVSPYKNSKVINEIGLELENIYNVKYLLSDFKKEDGYKRSIELSKEYDLYRQNYCGCLYSKGGNINE